jgi:hypothetical protein
MIRLHEQWADKSIVLTINDNSNNNNLDKMPDAIDASVRKSDQFIEMLGG